MLSLLTKNNKLVIKNNALLAVDPDSPSARAGFQAFDGSNRYFKRLKFWDLDCCYLEPRFFPNDGSFAIEKTIDCCCNSTCKVVESERWFGCSVPVGTIIPCPLSIFQAYTPLPDSCPPPPPGPIPRQWFSFTRQPGHLITPTKWGLGGCLCPGNPDPFLVYFELLDEIL